MGEPTEYQPHKVIVATIGAADMADADLADLVEAGFGAVDLSTPSMPFTFTSYYEREMGPGLRRCLFSLRDLADPSQLAALKQRSDAIERRYARAPDPSPTLPAAAAPTPASADKPARRVNLDPGLLSLSRVILATTKASAHRIPLSGGYHAEITLVYRAGAYRPLEWTYPDFRSDAFVGWLGEVRALYREQLRAIDSGRAWRL